MNQAKGCLGPSSMPLQSQLSQDLSILSFLLQLQTSSVHGPNRGKGTTLRDLTALYHPYLSL